MSNTHEISRRDFLKFIPNYLAHRVHAITKGPSRPADINTPLGENETIDDHCPKIAEIDTGCCLAWGGGSCQFCYLACPLRDKAIVIEDQKPMIDPSICDGCAKCAIACQTVNTITAVTMRPLVA